MSERESVKFEGRRGPKDRRIWEKVRQKMRKRMQEGRRRKRGRELEGGGDGTGKRAREERHSISLLVISREIFGFVGEILSRRDSQGPGRLDGGSKERWTDEPTENRDLKLSSANRVENRRSFMYRYLQIFDQLVRIFIQLVGFQGNR